MLQYKLFQVPLQYFRTAGAPPTSPARVEAAVNDGRLAPGDRLPSVRALAADLGLSPTTVQAAYNGLRRKGIVGRRGPRRHTGGRPASPPGAERAACPKGVRDLASGNPDAALLPPIASALRAVEGRHRLYGEPADREDLLASFARELACGRHRRARAHDRERRASTAWSGCCRRISGPGDTVAVEDPAYSGVLDLVRALGLVPRPVGIDDEGPLPDQLAHALEAGVGRGRPHAAGAEPDRRRASRRPRARELRRVLDRHRETLVIEDDHAGPIAGAPARSVIADDRPRWAVIRSMSKSLGPDLRVAVLAGDIDDGRPRRGTPDGRRRLGERDPPGGRGSTCATTPATGRLWRDAERTYTRRRAGLVAALAAHGIPAHGRSGLNVWVPVRRGVSGSCRACSRSGGRCGRGSATASPAPRRYESRRRRSRPMTRHGWRPTSRRSSRRARGARRRPDRLVPTP